MCQIHRPLAQFFNSISLEIIHEYQIYINITIMNELILQKRYIKNELKVNSNQINTNILLRNSIARKFKNYQQSNLKIVKALSKERHSEKRYQDLTERKNYIQEYQNQQVKNPEIQQCQIGHKEQSLLQKKVAQNNHESMLFANKKKQINIKQRYLFKINKAKNLSFQSLNKINNTQPLAKKKELDKTINQKSQVEQNEKTTLNLNKSYSCKSRPATYLINAQQLGQAFKNYQHKQPNSKIALRMKNDHNKRFYDQAISHLFQLAKKNVLIGKVQSEMPEQLGIKEIVCPKRQDWGNKLKKCKQAIQKKEQKVLESIKQHKSKQKLPYKIRTKTDAQLKCNRNQTQFDEKKLWFDLIQKPFQPWQYEKVSSNFFD